MTRRMSDGEIRSGIGRLGPWFHRLELAPGVVTKKAAAAREGPDHPLPTWKIVSRFLPLDLSGKSVLDVGCNAGFYSVESKRRGAARVLGVDAQRHQIRQALFAKRALALDLEFRRMSVYDLTPEDPGRFDVVLALGLVYHLKHLVLGLERLFDVTKELLVLETAVLPPSQVPDVPYPVIVGGPDRVHHPVAYVENDPSAKEAVFNWFVPSPRAARALLEDVGFDEVEIGDVTGDRAVLVCRRTRGRRSGAAHLTRYGARLEAVETPPPSPRDAVVPISVRATNTGRETWHPSGEGGDGAAVRTAGHLFRGDVEIDWLALEWPLPRAVAPGESLALNGTIQLPGEPGRYRLEIDLCLEGYAWFEDLGSPLLAVNLEVSEEPSPIPWFREEAAKDLPGALDTAGFLPRLFLAAWGHAATPEGIEALDGERRRLALDPASFVRRVLSRPLETAPPPPVGEAARKALLARCGVAAPAGGLSVGEATPGEAEAARAVLEDTASRDDVTFAGEAYRRILGREIDPRAAANVAERLTAGAGALLRPFFLRDLLWSGELRDR